MLGPFIRAGAERQSFRQSGIILTLQVIRKKTSQDVAPIIFGRLAAEFDRPKLLSLTPAPPAVIPRAYDQKILMSRIAPLEQLVDLHRTVEVFLVPPAGYIQCGHGHFVKPWSKTLSFPKRVVVRMVNEIVPGRELSIE